MVALFPAMQNLDHICFAGVEPAPLPTGRMRRPTRDLRSSRVTSEAPPSHPLVGEVLRRAGLKPGYYRPAALARRLSACERLPGWREAAAQMPAAVAPRLGLLHVALNTLLIGVTEFFRDAPVFDALERDVMPQLAARAGALRVYAAGVSAGQELYSVAMLLADAGLLERSKLVGVDCRPDAIAWARGGIYPAEALREVSLSRRRYFEPMGGSWQVNAALRARVRWQVADLFESARAAGPADLILFRNVAIYFEAEHAERAWRLLCGQLAPGGFLVTGKAEKPPFGLPLRRVGPCLYQKGSD